MLKNLMRHHFNGSQDDSIAHSFRMRRMRFFEERFAESFGEEIASGRRVKVLDLGGTWSFWKSMRFKYIDDIDLTLLNLNEPKVPDGIHNVKGAAGDATNLSQYSDGEFDLVFSNSVIEHVGNEQAQQRMADEMRRVGRHCYLQTPNKYFPIEPHFMFPPYIQLFPMSVKIFLFMHFRIGWHKEKAASHEEAQRIAGSVNLLTMKALKQLFPDAEIQREKFMLLTKSFYLFV